MDFEDIESRIYGKGITLDNYCKMYRTKPEDYDIKSVGLTMCSEHLHLVVDDWVASYEFVKKLPENAEAVINYDSQIFMQTITPHTVQPQESYTHFNRIERGDVLIPKKTPKCSNSKKNSVFSNFIENF